MIDPQSQQKIAKRIKRIGGQIQGIQKMVEEDRYCIDIMTQMLAIKRALSAVEDEILHEHLGSCVAAQFKRGETKKAQSELSKIYKLAKRQ